MEKLALWSPSKKLQRQKTEETDTNPDFRKAVDSLVEAEPGQGWTLTEAISCPSTVY